MTTLRILYLFLFFGLLSPTYAQSLGEFKSSDKSYGVKKIKSDRIYISNFEVNFQIYNEKQDFKQGGNMFGGGKRGDAMAEASIGIQGVTEKGLQSITNDLYQEYVEQLKAEGLELVSADEAGKTKVYEGFERLDNAPISEAEIPGTLSVYPEGYSFYVKGETKKGKKKKGGFLGDSGFLSPALSKQLDDAIIARVNLTVLFVEDKNAFKGNGAKIKVKTNLRLVANEAVVMKKSDEKKIKFKGENSTTPVSSLVEFSWGKVGMGSQATYTGTLKKPLEINDVVEDTKVTSYAAGSVDALGTETIYGTWYSVEDRMAKHAKIIEVDEQEFNKGVYEALQKFVMHHTDTFLDELK